MDRKDEDGEMWRDYYWKGYYTGCIKLNGTGKLARNVRIPVSNGTKSMTSVVLFTYMKCIKDTFPTATADTILSTAKEQFKSDVCNVIDEMTKV